MNSAELHNLTRKYLSLPESYANALGGMRWSFVAPGLTGSQDYYLSNEALAQFFEGFVTQSEPLAFGSMIHWAKLFEGRWLVEGNLGLLGPIFKQTGTYWRNAGALAGMISQDFPKAAQAVPVDLLCRRLRSTEFSTQMFVGSLNPLARQGEEPPLSPSDFERQVCDKVNYLGAVGLHAWLKNGRGPIAPAGKKLAEQPLPGRKTGNWFDELWQLPRLAGAKTYLNQMISAVTLPPRRLSPKELPIGGYSDIITRGDVDQLLPSQHALDDLDFLRRFAEHELLFFRREQPSSPQRYQVVCLLDQGVRTWGDPRLVLAAGVVALAEKMGQRKIPLTITCTSSAEVECDPIQQSADGGAGSLGKVLEASDSSLNPGLALESVLERTSPAPRDILLLTHPANLMESDVRTAARRLRPSDRLFALTLDRHGQAELCEFRRGLPIRLRQFRVDFVQAVHAAVSVPKASSSWTGDVEAVSWPFVIGADGAIALYDFDVFGRRLLTVTVSGMLHVWNLADKKVEILSRPLCGETVLTSWLAVTGVLDGFVLAGKHGDTYVIAHYDVERRQCRVHRTSFFPIDDPRLLYSVRFHAVILRDAAKCGARWSLDLETGEIGLIGGDHRPSLALAAYFKQPDWDRMVEPADGQDRPNEWRYMAYSQNGRFDAVRLVGPENWPLISFEREGKKVLEHSLLHQVQKGQQTVVLAFTWPGTASWTSLSVFDGPSGHFIRELLIPKWNDQTDPHYCLSRDGSGIAFQRQDGGIEVRATRLPEFLLLTRKFTKSILCRLLGKR